MKTSHFLALTLLSALLAGSIAAAEPAADESERLRSALRDSMQQLRSTQSDLATLQAGQGAIAEEKKALTEKYESLKKQIVADRTSGDKTVANLKEDLDKQRQLSAQLKEALDHAKAEGEKSAQEARQAETQGAAVSKDNIVLERRVADQESKNLALFLIANEILTRYEEFTLGNALRAKEPFVGSTRTKLENLVQDYQDKILDQRTKP